MEQDGDWVREHRSVMDHPVFQDDWLYRLFRWCIMKANFAQGSFRGRVIKPGQFATGRERAANQLGVHPSKFHRGITKLSNPPYDCIKVKSNSEFTIITVCNYKTYQNVNLLSEQRSNNDRTASEQPANTIEEQQEGKKNKKETPIAPKGALSRRTARRDDREYSTEFLEFWLLFPSVRKGSKPVAWDAWQRAVLRKPASEILSAAREFADSPKAKSKFCPGPAPWLNQDRWDDDREAWALGDAPPVEEEFARVPTDEELAAWNDRNGGAS